MTADDLTLFYPADIAHAIGLSAPEINSLKAKGCRFLGKKTTIRWVREWIDANANPRPAGSPVPATSAHA